jgi:hypothetical protein
MPNNKKLLVNGCSFSRGPTAWPYQLTGVEVVNLACAGSGNTYIYESTISEISKRDYNFVAVMWTGIERIDIKVENIDVFDKSKYTSKYQSTKNDWSGKVIYPVNDQDYVEKDWVFGCGFINQEPELLNYKLFDKFYQHSGFNEFAQGLLIKMISLQSVLKQLEIPYLFMYYNDYKSELKKFSNLYDMLDQTNIFNEYNINTITKTNGWFDEDRIHPGVLAHKEWANLINPLILNNAKNT